jgi:predicted alpha/beta-hydrolase family hydrolase
VKPAAEPQPFVDRTPGLPDVRGALHRPVNPNGDAIVLTHGAGSDADGPLLVALATAFADAGFLALRCDLPYRQTRRVGPPSPRSGVTDRLGLRRAALALRAITPGRVFLGGHSYGGRQATMLAAGEPELVTALLALSYPLHPPTRPADLRTAHFPSLTTPVLFVHGTLDPFGTIDEMQTALSLIPAPTRLVVCDGAAHDLGRGRRPPRPGTTLGGLVVDELRQLAGGRGQPRRADARDRR